MLSDNFFELMSVGSDDLIQQKSFSSYCINFWPFTIRRIIFRSLFTTFTRMIHLSDDIHFFHCFILFGNRQICYQTLRSLPTDISAPSFYVIDGFCVTSFVYSFPRFACWKVVNQTIHLFRNYVCHILPCLKNKHLNLSLIKRIEIFDLFDL